MKALADRSPRRSRDHPTREGGGCRVDGQRRGRSWRDRLPDGLHSARDGKGTGASRWW